MAYNQILPSPSAYLGAPAPSVTDVPATLSLNERLSIALQNLSILNSTVFDTGMRLGVLQPVPQAAPPKDLTQPHAIELLNMLETTINQMSESVHRIRTFAG